MNNRLKQVSLSLAGVSLITACSSFNEVDKKIDSAHSTETSITFPAFKEDDGSIIGFEKTKRRKWDGAVVTDLDQDGLTDIVITNHGNTTDIYWNLGDKFSVPVTLLNRDTHGVTAADFDRDGKVEIVIAQGGGDGKNPKFPMLFEIGKNREITHQPSMDHFEFTRGRTAKFIDADNDGKLELIITGFPLKSQTDGANLLYEYSDNDDRYEYVNNLPQAKWLGYRAQSLDFNNDGDQDILFYGGANIVALAGDEGKSFKEVSSTTLGDLQNINDVQSVALIDFDNDGDQDLFLSRAKHQFYNQTFFDKENKRLAFFTFKRKPEMYDIEIDGNMIIDNLQIAYPDFKIFLGSSMTVATLNDDQHGHHDLNIKPTDAHGWPEDTSKNGIYVGFIGENKWKLFINTRSRNAGVIHNVINEFENSNLEALPAKLLENQNGKFIDATEKLNINIQEQTTSAAIADFNNDGYKDILAIRYGNMAKSTQQILLMNNKGQAFEQITTHDIVSKELGATGNGAATLDFDYDGDMDLIYANERGLWHLFENLEAQQSNNYFVGFTIGSSPEGAVDPLGAKITVKACGHSQTEYIGSASNAFSQSINNSVHFGLGECDSVESATILWRSGEQVLMKNVAIGEYNRVN